MPIYEFECPVHGRFEKILTITEGANRVSIICLQQDEKGYCLKDAEKVWSIPAGDLSIGKPTRMFINVRTGEPFSPMSSYDKPPKGYREIELRNPAERSRFEKEQQRRVDAENQLTSHILDSMKSEARQKRHDNLNARMNSVQKEENPITGQVEEFTLDHKEKALVKKAMERSKTKKPKEKKSNVILAVNHYNKSNLDEVK